MAADPLGLDPLGPIPRSDRLGRLPEMVGSFPIVELPRTLSGADIGQAIRDRVGELDRVLPQLEAERAVLREMLEVAERPITLGNGPAGQLAGDTSQRRELADSVQPSPSPVAETPPADDESDRPAGDHSERYGGQDVPPPGREERPASAPPGPAAEEPPDERPVRESVRTSTGFASSVLAALRDSSEPKTRRGLAVAMGLSPKVDVVRVGRALGQLVRDGLAEECGSFRSGTLYRPVEQDPGDASPATAAGDDASRVATGDESPRAQDDASRLQGDEPSSSTPATPPISRRVRRELEREASPDPGGDASPVDLLDQKILDALQAGPLGPRALAIGIGHAHPTERLYDSLRRLIATGRVVEHRNGGTGIGEERHQFEATGR